MCKPNIALKYKATVNYSGKFEEGFKELISEYVNDHISVKEQQGDNYIFDIYSIV